MHDAFWLTCGAGSVEDEERVFSIHFCWWAVCGDFFDLFVVPKVTAFSHVDVATGALYDEHFVDVAAFLDRTVGIFLQWHGSATTNAFVGGDYEARGTVFNTACETIW